MMCLSCVCGVLPVKDSIGKEGDVCFVLYMKVGDYVHVYIYRLPAVHMEEYTIGYGMAMPV